MKQRAALPSILFSILLFTSCESNKTHNLSLLDHQTPDNTPLIFAEGIISTDDFEFTITFTPEMDELYFTRRKPDEDNAVYGIKLENNVWSEPEIAFFTSNEGWDFEPHISPNGDRLYFGSVRPLNDTASSAGLHQWYSKRTASGWDDPRPLEKPFIDRRITMYLTSAENGNLYFTTGEEGVKPEDWDIHTANNINGEYSEVIRMGPEINFDGKYIAHSYIAPDESYMIYDGESDSGYGDCDLYISFNRDGQWSEAINLGPEINTDQCEMCASVSPDGRYLFFHRGSTDENDKDTGNIYWVDLGRVLENIE
ncbi:PD40 domain-containing protein [Aureitalea marina]|uniref:PD40 domain-containing protein n=1 Tax=Aureitalea marina TaxID=930804 RepID=UPI0015E31171|nr:PD40 domain-containing protein [Aureitalea marina]